MKKSRNRKIQMAFLAVAVLLSFAGCKEPEKQPEEKDAKAEEKEWEEAEILMPKHLTFGNTPLHAQSEEEKCAAERRQSRKQQIKDPFPCVCFSICTERGD